MASIAALSAKLAKNKAALTVLKDKGAALKAANSRSNTARAPAS